MLLRDFLPVFLFLGGIVVAIVANYIKFMNEFNYIKGQLSQILEVHEGFTDLVERHAKMELNLIKTIKDLDKAFSRIKILETSFTKEGRN